jgi:hypothetical protein
MWAYALLTILRAVQLPLEEAPKNSIPTSTKQYGGLQGSTRPTVPWSVGEIRRLFWRLVLATQPRVERILAWSSWLPLAARDCQIWARQTACSFISTTVVLGVWSGYV